MTPDQDILTKATPWPWRKIPTSTPGEAILAIGECGAGRWGFVGLPEPVVDRTLQALNAYEHDQEVIKGLSEAVNSVLPFLPNDNGWSTGGGMEWFQRLRRVTEQLHAALAAAEGGA